MTTNNYITQTLLPPSSGFPPQLHIRRISLRHAGNVVRHLTHSVSGANNSRTARAIGIAYHFSPRGSLAFVALANAQIVIRIDFSENEKSPHVDGALVHLLGTGEDSLTAVNDWRPRLVGFGLARTAVRLQQKLRYRIRGVDVAKIDASAEDFTPAEVAQQLLSRNVDKWEVTRLWLGDENMAERNVCLQAWLAACIGNSNIEKVESTLAIDTRYLNQSELEWLGELITQSDLMESMKPKESIGDFSKVAVNKFGKVEIMNSRYKTRVRSSHTTRVVMTRHDGQQYIGTPQHAKGRKTMISLPGAPRDVGGVTRVRIIGRQNLTNSEKARERLIHCLLTGLKNLRESPFIRLIWFPLWKKLSFQTKRISLDQDYVDNITFKMNLNDSQRRVVVAMTSENELPLVVTHGPPGTGKTTTIAAASRIWDLCRCHVWIVAHSNVAVKNIAETLFKKEVDFKLLVSKEFFEEWHEHLYEEIQQKVIRSDELPKDIGDMARMFGDTCIVLCTLSMISNPALRDVGAFEIIPVERLVIDEASQINTFEYLTIFETFQHVLQKVCFFGDPRQLPPFGQDRVRSIKTIFDYSLKMDENITFFLDVQYRMPVPIGQFISKYVYEGRLKSQHKITDSNCVTCINVDGQRSYEERAGSSWKNDAEVQIVVHLIKHYFKNSNFCVITPYDAQRAAIESAVKAASPSLPWDSIYNLDSFQGNEADYVIISIVRTGSQPGFLAMLNRLNVLLTRCRKANIIVTNKQFIELGGSRTLLGTMVAHWEHVLKSPQIWLDWRLISTGAADLPGHLGPNRRQQSAVLPPVQSARNTQCNTPRTISSRDATDPWRVAEPVLRESKCTTPHSPIDIDSLWPPLAASKMPILKGSWKTLTSPPDVVQKHSLLPRTSRLPALARVQAQEPPLSSRESKHVDDPIPKCVRPGRKQILFNHGVTPSNVYCRRR